jgi:hypothetical protein
VSVEAENVKPEKVRRIWSTSGVHMPSAADWPTFRHDIARSGSVKTDIPALLVPVWRKKLGTRPRSPVCVGGRLFVPCYDREGVICVDTQNGEMIWEFSAGGAVDSPPTIHRGLAIFGARDGYVYAVTTTDGELVWRFRAAPVDSLVMEEGRLSSAWPVNGSVLVLDDTAYFAAGRSSFVDGGIRIYGIDALTGEKKHEITVHTDSPRPRLSPASSTKTGPARKGRRGKKVRSRRPQSSTSTPGGLLSDVLHSDGNGIFMRQQGFSLDLRPRRGGKVLCTNYGFLNDSWMHRVNWTLGGGASYKNPFGKLLVFDAAYAFGAQSYYTWQKHSPWKWPADHTGHHHQKYSRYRPGMFPFGVRLYSQANQPVTAGFRTPDMSNIDKYYYRWSKPALSSNASHAWSQKMPAQVRAMVLTNKILFVAGWKDSIAIFKELQSEDTGTPALWAVDRASGETLAEYVLPAAPVFDGMIAANARLYITLRSGEVVCYTGR